MFIATKFYLLNISSSDRSSPLWGGRASLCSVPPAAFSPGVVPRINTKRRHHEPLPLPHPRGAKQGIRLGGGRLRGRGVIGHYFKGGTLRVVE